MGLINTLPIIKKESWESAVEFSVRTRQALQQLTHLRLGPGSSPTFVSPTLTGLTATRLVQTNSAKALSSVSNLALWVLQDSANRVTVSDEGNGTVKLSLPQDIHTSAYPVFINTNTAMSPMIMTGGAVSAGTNAGTVKVAALTAMLRTDTGETDTLTRITLAEQDNITLENADTFYHIILTYGEPCTIATSATGGNGANVIGIGHCLKEDDDTMHFATAGLRLNDGVRKLHRRATHLREMEKDGGGALVASTGTRNFTITSGHFHRGINEYSFDAKDTSGTDTFDYYYYNPTSGEWVKDDNTGSHYAALDNVQYNNVDAGTGLANLTAQKYTTNWIFVHPDDEHIIVVYGRSNGTLTTAQNEKIPASLPDVIDRMALLLAKVIVKEGSNTLIVENVEYFVFVPDITVDHNELAGLQGGTADEYYHMTAAEHTTGAAIMALTPTNGNIIVGDGTTWVAESGATARTSLGLGTTDNVEFGNITGTKLDIGAHEVTCGSINRATGTLTLEIAGTPQLSLSSTLATFAGTIVAASGNLNLGVEDTTRGVITAYGPSAGVYGGSLVLHTGADHDAAIESYHIWAYEDDLVIGGTAGTAITIAGTTVTYEGDVHIVGTTTYDSNIIIPDNGWIGSVTTNQAIQIASTGNITMPGTLNVTGDLAVTGNISLTVNDGSVGYTDNSPMIVFDNTNDFVEVVGTGLCLPDEATFGGTTVTDCMYFNGVGDIVLNYNLFGKVIKLEEQANPVAHAGGFGQIWVKSTEPSELWYQDDADNDYQIAPQDLRATASPTFAGLTLSGTATVEGASVTIGKASTTTGTLVLHDSNSANTITLTVPDISAGSLSFTLPATDGDNTNVLQTDGNGVLSWVAGAAAANHAILDGSVHTDSVADGVSRGSLIYGNATPKWDELVKGAADTFLGSDGTDISYRTAAQVMASLSASAGAAFDLNGQDLTNGGVIFLTEQANAEADVEGKGQLWVKTATPNKLYFTDDAGNDFPLGGCTDRGDPDEFDWEETGSKAVLNTDANWHDLDLSGIVPAGATFVLLRIRVVDDAVSSVFNVKKKGNANALTGGSIRTQVVDIPVEFDIPVAVDADRKIEYLATNTAFTFIRITVKGWWT